MGDEPGILEARYQGTSLAPYLGSTVGKGTCSWPFWTPPGLLQIVKTHIILCLDTSGSFFYLLLYVCVVYLILSCTNHCIYLFISCDIMGKKNQSTVTALIYSVL